MSTDVDKRLAKELLDRAYSSSSQYVDPVDDNMDEEGVCASHLYLFMLIEGCKKILELLYLFMHSVLL